MMNRTLFLIALIVAFASHQCEATLTAPETASAGSLVIIKSDAPAVWSIQPKEYAADAYVDSNGQTLALALAKPGTVYIFAATVDEDGEPAADVVQLTVIGTDIDVVPLPPVNPDPPPTPEPPQLTFPEEVKAEVDKLDAPTKLGEIEAFVSVLNATVKFVDDGQVRTVSGLRETIRRNLQLRFAVTSADAFKRWEPVCEKLYDGLDKDDVKKARDQLADVVKEFQKTCSVCPPGKTCPTCPTCPNFTR